MKLSSRHMRGVIYFTSFAVGTIALVLVAYVTALAISELATITLEDVGGAAGRVVNGFEKAVEK